MEGVLKNNNLISEENVEVRPESFPDAILDIHLVRRYFSSDAWLVVMECKQSMPHILGEWIDRKGDRLQ